MWALVSALSPGGPEDQLHQASHLVHYVHLSLKVVQTEGRHALN